MYSNIDSLVLLLYYFIEKVFSEYFKKILIETSIVNGRVETMNGKLTLSRRKVPSTNKIQFVKRFSVEELSFNRK